MDAVTRVELQSNWCKLDLRRMAWEAKRRLHLTTMTLDEYHAACRERDFEVNHGV